MKHKKIHSLILLAIIAIGMGFCLHKIEAKKSELWLGATYAAAKAGATAEQGLLIGAVGLGQTSLWSVGFAMAGAGPAGVIVGVAFGL